MSHSGALVIFTNSSKRTCTERAYPWVDGLNDAGKAIRHAQRARTGWFGGLHSTGPLPTVRLAPGDTASTMVEGVEVGDGSPGECPSITGLLITPPNTRTSTRVNGVLVAGCDFSVHPLIAGAEGGSPQ